MQTVEKPADGEQNVLPQISRLGLANQANDGTRSDPAGVHEVFHTPACLCHMFAHLTDLHSLGRAAAVCKTWSTVLQSDEIWRSAYLSNHPEPAPHEALDSYRQLVHRLYGLLALPTPEPGTLKGSAICYNPTTRNLVSFNAPQRLLSVKDEAGVVQSAILEVEGNASASKPLLVSSGSNLVLLSAFDGRIMVWDAATCHSEGCLGVHPSFVLHLAADGNMVVSICSRQIILWALDTREQLWSHRTPLVGGATNFFQPRVVVSEAQQLLAFADASPISPSNIVKVLSTAEGSRGKMIQELPVNALADMVLQDSLLLVGSSFMGRSSGSQSEKPYTLVVTIWEVDTWQCTRLISPKLWAPANLRDLQGLPLLHVTQGLLLCASLSATQGGLPTCTIHGWRLPVKPQDAHEGLWWGTKSAPGLPGEEGLGGGATLRLTAREHRNPGLTSTLKGGHHAGEGGLAAQQGGGAAGVMAGSGSGEGSSSSSSSRGPRVVMVDGSVREGGGEVAVRPAEARNSAVVLLLGRDGSDRDEWQQLVKCTKGRLTAFTTTPTHLVGATEGGTVMVSKIPFVVAENSSRSSSG